MALRFDTDQRTRLRRLLMLRGGTLAELLAQVLSGKSPAAIAAMMKPGKRPEEVLREALSQVEGRRKLIDADDDGYGRCDVCRDDLGVTALEEMAWADRCRTHSAI